MCRYNLKQSEGAHVTFLNTSRNYLKKFIVAHSPILKVSTNWQTNMAWTYDDSVIAQMCTNKL